MAQKAPKQDPFSVILDMTPESSFMGLEEGVYRLSGQPFHREGDLGLAESLEAVAQARLLLAPTYTLIAGREFTDMYSEAWKDHDSRAERLTIHDEYGIVGSKGERYVVDIQNGGLFVWNPARIRDAVTNKTLDNGAMRLTRSEVMAFLDAYERKDNAGLREIVHGERMAFAGTYEAFIEASAERGFLSGRDATYVVLRPLSDAKAWGSGVHILADHRSNADLIIASGGKAPAEKLLDKVSSFGWKEFGAWHDGYELANTGRVVSLGPVTDGVNGRSGLDRPGCGVGVVPAAREAFYSARHVGITGWV